MNGVYQKGQGNANKQERQIMAGWEFSFGSFGLSKFGPAVGMEDDATARRLRPFLRVSSFSAARSGGIPYTTLLLGVACNGLEVL
ncbi:hypothetical protein FJTKL_06930 [Diaporthe vaccinii]|uniref:Uncharacterized protein n=1 Tax=Diaporthe vaccinii TaxID=105482 RepID=A0ABR4EVV6_9PEZI